uniref:Uncharacterized protein n=1 Tax=Arundo donax TaxID=35708 RepID=A0A0A9B4I6_ARUDO
MPFTSRHIILFSNEIKYGTCTADVDLIHPNKQQPPTKHLK